LQWVDNIYSNGLYYYLNSVTYKAIKTSSHGSSTTCSEQKTKPKYVWKAKRAFKTNVFSQPVFPFLENFLTILALQTLLVIHY